MNHSSTATSAAAAAGAVGGCTLGSGGGEQKKSSAAEFSGLFSIAVKIPLIVETHQRQMGTILKMWRNMMMMMAEEEKVQVFDALKKVRIEIGFVGVQGF